MQLSTAVSAILFECLKTGLDAIDIGVAFMHIMHRSSLELLIIVARLCKAASSFYFYFYFYILLCLLEPCPM